MLCKHSPSELQPQAHKQILIYKRLFYINTINLKKSLNKYKGAIKCNENQYFFHSKKLVLSSKGSKPETYLQHMQLWEEITVIS
jgi:hypothetical protein